MTMQGPIRPEEARVNVTYGGKNGDLPDPVHYDSTDGDIRGWVTEAVRGGNIPGIDADQGADFQDFVVDRFSANDARPHNLIQVRPKTPFGEHEARVRTALDWALVEYADTLAKLAK